VIDNEDALRALIERVSNWGRWGPDDERGTLNHITPAVVVEASRLVRRGEVFALGIPLDRDGPQEGAPRRFNPIHMMSALPTETIRDGGVGISDDVLVLPLQAGTQWDALAHIAHDGMLYGGRPASAVGIDGASVNSIKAAAPHVFTRGVLIDVPRSRGVDELGPSDAITLTDLEGALEQAAVEVRSGDAVLVRTGHLVRCRARGWAGYRDTSPGLTVDTLEWLHDREVAAVASDTICVEVKPSTVRGVMFPFHAVAITYMGMLLGEIFDMEHLAADCAGDGVYEFLFAAPPLPVTAGIGSPVNPYAVK
jgi:kynurenine formamidase